MLAFIHLFSLFSGPADQTPVRATLADGQVLMGEVHTQVLRLATGAGVLEIPLADVGEVVPARGGDLGVAEGRVDVWLRNGSALRGRWSEPEVEMGIAVGGGEVSVDLPMNDLSRFQLQGAAEWPTTAVFRMQTTWGDDFLVDPTRTRLVLKSGLGTFSPLLAECVSAAPVGAPDGDWRIVLRTGTVLIGALQDKAVTVALPMGPEQITVPLANFVSLRAETWQPAPAPLAPPPLYREATGYGARAPAAAEDVSATRTAPTGAVDGWFDSSPIESAKSAQSE